MQFQVKKMKHTISGLKNKTCSFRLKIKHTISGLKNKTYNFRFKK